MYIVKKKKGLLLVHDLYYVLQVWYPRIFIVNNSNVVYIV